MPVVTAVRRAKWEVMWLRRGAVVRKDCGSDLAEALRILELVKGAGRKGATLRSKNIAFPPPAKYADTEQVPIGRSKRTRKIVYAERTIEPPQYLTTMRSLNKRGVWWCPYCMKMRRFTRVKGFELDGIWVDKVQYVCPLCGVSHGLVRRFNPLAAEIDMRRRGRSRSTSARSRRRNRKEQ